jgi:hypothetical protein
MLRFSRFLFALPLLAPAFACIVSRPTVEDAIDQFGPVACDRVAACNKAGFDATYPNGQSQCVNKMKDAVKAQFGSDAMSKLDACTQSELDQCTADIRVAACAAFTDTSKLPESCKKC